jgi:uncharacterized protein
VNRHPGDGRDLGPKMHELQRLRRPGVPAFAATTCIALLWLVLVAFASPAAAQNFPPLTGRVVDQAGLLRPEQVFDLESKSEALEAATKRQFVVATVKSLEGRTIEEYGYQLGRKWKIGDEKRDDGVILLVAPNEKKVRIETGYGARVFLTDAVSGLIVQNTILPKFRQGDLPGGIMAGADQIIEQMKLSPEQAKANAAAAEKQRSARPSPGIFAFLPVIIIVIVFFSIIASLSRRARGRRYRRRRGGGVDPWVVLWGLNELSRGSRGGGWGGGGGGFGGFGGGGGGGFGGFSGGGGSFGGGGASGGW